MRVEPMLILAALGLLSCKPDSPEPNAASGDRCALVRKSVAAAGFGDDVAVTCDGTNAYLTSDTYPDHVLMTGIVGTNEQIPVPAADYAAPVRLNPVRSGKNLSRDKALGTAVNGVPIYDYTSAGELSEADLGTYSSRLDTVATGQLDVCGGHAGRGDDYHYHASPTCMIESMKNAGDDAVLGWGFDGFPIYGDNNPDGSKIADGALDLCNGQDDAVFGYRYHTSTAWPYILQCLVGEVDEKALPRVPPLDKLGGGGKDAGVPPRGGVENLVMSDVKGTRSMTYEHQGQSYHISYSPAQKSGCFDFEYKTVTNGGVTETGTFCR